MQPLFFQKNVVRESVKGFTKFLTDHIHSLSLIHKVGHPVSKGDHVDQAGPADLKSLLAGPDPLFFLHVSPDGTKDDLFHDLTCH